MENLSRKSFVCRRAARERFYDVGFGKSNVDLPAAKIFFRLRKKVNSFRDQLTANEAYFVGSFLRRIVYDSVVVQMGMLKKQKRFMLLIY